MGTATFVKNIKVADQRPGFVLTPGPKALYRLDPPYLDKEAHGAPIEYVYVSTATVLDEVETYAFRSNADGEWLDSTELRMSMKGVASHATILAEAGYTIVAGATVPEEE